MRPAISLWQWMSTPHQRIACDILFQDGFHRGEPGQPWEGDEYWELSKVPWYSLSLYQHQIYLSNSTNPYEFIKSTRQFERPYCVIVPVKDWAGSLCLDYVDRDNHIEVRLGGNKYTQPAFTVYQWIGGVGKEMGRAFAWNEPYIEGKYGYSHPTGMDLMVCATELGLSMAVIWTPADWFMKKAVLTTRTSDTEGVITLGEDHGFDDHRLDLRWDGGTRTNVESVTSTETAVISDGTGDVLPAVDTPMYVEICRSHYRPYYTAGGGVPYRDLGRPWSSGHIALKPMGYPLKMPSISVIRPATTANRWCPVTSAGEWNEYHTYFGGARMAPILVDATVPAPINGTCGTTCQDFAGPHVLHARSDAGWQKFFDAGCGADDPRLELVLDGAVATLSLYTYHDYNATAVWQSPWVMPSPCETWEDWPPIDLDLEYVSGNYYQCDFRGTTAHVTSRPFRESA